MSQLFPWTSEAPRQGELVGELLLAEVVEGAAGLTWQWSVVLEAPDGHNKGMHAPLGSRADQLGLDQGVGG